MDLFFVLKLIVVVFFLVMFLRNSRIVWGIGLLTVSTAFLLDTIWTTFGREEILADVGFFFYVLSGALFAGAALWSWSLLRPLLQHDGQQTVAVANPAPAPAPAAPLLSPPVGQVAIDGVPTDLRELFEDIRMRLSPQDVYDLIFDLQMDENEIIAPQQEMVHTITRMMNKAYAEDKIGALALAVERILTPVPPESLPRPEKLNTGSPPTVLRHHLLAHYSLEDLKILARQLEVDYEYFEHDTKAQMARNLLRHLQGRNQIGRLIERLHADAAEMN